MIDEIFYSFNPIYNKDSSVLILGSFPSVKSRDIDFYYGNPNNRFWKILEYITDCPYSTSSQDEKIALLHKHGIALWDMVESCQIKGSMDSDLNLLSVNNISKVLEQASISKIYCNGNLSDKLFQKYYSKDYASIEAKLPSSSPANARFRLKDLVKAWSLILPYIKTELELTTLVYIENAGRYLMLNRNKKANDINHGKWIGLGGHIEKEESADACIAREVYEESGLVIKEEDFKTRGFIKFKAQGHKTEIMYLYSASCDSDKLIECDEGDLAWIDKDAIMELNLWEGDKIFLDKLLKNQDYFCLSLNYDREGHLIDSQEI